MKASESLGAEALKQLLTRCWMSHDAMWFKSAVDELGIERANKLNRAAIRALAPIEVRRFMAALGLEKVESHAQLRTFLEGARDLAAGDFMDFPWTWRADGSLRVEVRKCFAHEGVTRLGVIEGYECGIFDRIQAWVEALGVEFEITPGGSRCMMHFEGECFREFRFSLSPEDR
jgi:hypothetical protein